MNSKYGVHASSAAFCTGGQGQKITFQHAKIQQWKQPKDLDGPCTDPRDRSIGLPDNLASSPSAALCDVVGKALIEVGVKANSTILVIWSPDRILDCLVLVLMSRCVAVLYLESKLQNEEI
ncbi:unnamed protein product [Albugo candida]|uniref:Uncharacterized protein n=1 Tax=Albugo candida TaxID=65357 RepID=A0A024FXT4_9STRA|nr:unnamed protein product [Albugo candida]|eukprot:CCI11732.1 unnamed protein product [Albugo candida]